MFVKIWNSLKRYKYFIFAMLFLVICCGFSVLFFSREKKETVNGQAEVYLYDSQVKLANEERLSTMEEISEEDISEDYEEAEQHGMENADKYTLDDILEENGQYSFSNEEESITEETEDYVFDKDDWRLILVNKQHPVPEDYTVELETIKGNMQCDARIISDLIAMFQAADADGVNLAVCSPYRDLSRQEWLFERKIKSYMKNGMSYMEAYSLASQIVMVPGASEHQLGLAIDINCDTYTSLDEGFADTEAGKWLAAHCFEYGFILRYPLGKEYITGVEYEPWHFRYVGKEAATVITEQGICLEEFIEGL